MTMEPPIYSLDNHHLTTTQLPPGRGSAPAQYSSHAWLGASNAWAKRRMRQAWRCGREAGPGPLVSRDIKMS